MSYRVMEIYGRWGFLSLPDAATVFEIARNGAQYPLSTAIGKTPDVREAHARLIASGLNLADCSSTQQEIKS